MRIDRFLNNRSQEVTLAIHQQGFGYLKDGEAKAAKFLHEMLSVLCAILLIPKVLLEFLAVNIGLRKVPAPVLEILQHQMQTADHSKKSKAAKKVGFQTPAKPGPVMQ